MQNLHSLNIQWKLSHAISPLSMLGGPRRTLLGLPSIDNGSYDTEKIPLNTQVTEEFA